MEAVEVFGCDVEEGGQFEIGGTPFGQIILIGDRDDDAFHPRGFGGDQAVEGIFKCETFERVC